MKTGIPLLAALVLATTAQAGMSSEAMCMMDMPMMKDHVTQLHEHMAKLKAAKPGKEREQLMVEHMDMLDQHMDMMMKGMGMMMDGKGMGGAAMDPGAKPAAAPDAGAKPAAPAAAEDHSAHHPQ